MSGVKGAVAFGDVRNEVLGQLAELVSESEIVYRELVLPNWGSEDRHGFPRTLYGYVMSSFAFIDLLSGYRHGDRMSQNQENAEASGRLHGRVT